MNKKKQVAKPKPTTKKKAQKDAPKAVPKAVPTHRVGYNGEDYFLPLVKTGVGEVPTEQKQSLMELLCLMYSDGHSIEEAAKYCGINAKTFNNWRDANPDFSNMFVNAQISRMEKKREDVSRMAYEAIPSLMLGGERKIITRITKPVYDEDGKQKLDKHGEPMLRVSTIIEKIQPYGPNAAFVMFAMSRTEPGQYAAPIVEEAAKHERKLRLDAASPKTERESFTINGMEIYF